MTRNEFYEIGTKAYGENRREWIFICPWCKYKQSMNSIRASLNKEGFHKSQRYGIITEKNIKKLNPSIDQECLSPDCNFASYGLFSGDLEIDGHNYLLLAVQQNTEEVKPNV